ncbi:N-acetylmuramoyl-L-alanine amidase [Salipaludibacillus sp. LMS25]|uniref:N-acetylmuramoyl-L-alanine amidase n=1 Tax=Salipaludibacillus sp. LMS25 TaxID=2924031 RepID=UPI0020D11431|nr:N-acetylmuramoyl-L-alanine amidase [Salipaludibacillus sp. LMS25]UTR13613.1 N-acetylmuramoyl-L-alanine amidase [Salipaludibacillus sp. LMS25]
MVRIFIDPGHGGSDSGAIGNGLVEKEIVLDIATRLRALLNVYQAVETNMSRDDDRFVSLSERANMANGWNADFFISIHANAGGGEGFESYIWNGDVPEQTITYQQIIHEAILDEIDALDRGMLTANFAVLRETAMSALLTENLFVDNERDAEKLRDDAFLERIARGHAIGIVSALNIDDNGSNGSDNTIATVQATLNERYGLSIAVDNIFGPETKGALLKGFQTELNVQFNRNIQVDGIWGPETRQAVVNVRRGARGNITWILQAMLYGSGVSPGPVDGIFGPLTERAVRTYQHRYKLIVDGIAGRQTFTALFR